MIREFRKDTNELQYWIAAGSNEKTPNTFSTYEVPAAKWAVFEVVGLVAVSVPDTLKKVYSEWFPAHDYQQIGAPR